jgi:hypothetical protein
VTIQSPGAVVKAKGDTNIAASASDNNGSDGLKQSLYVDGRLMTTVTGGVLQYAWNARKAGAGTHTITVVATDAALTSRPAPARCWTMC